MSKKKKRLKMEDLDGKVVIWNWPVASTLLRVVLPCCQRRSRRCCSVVAEKRRDKPYRPRIELVARCEEPHARKVYETEVESEQEQDATEDDVPEVELSVEECEPVDDTAPDDGDGEDSEHATCGGYQEGKGF